MNLILKGIQVMTITSQFMPNYQVETVKFADGSTQTLTGLQITTNGTDGSESLSGLMYNASANDIINGKGGDDYIYGYSGNDTLTDGTGNDYLDGGDGNDTFVYNPGDGLDTITDAAGTDVIKIGAGFVKADLTWQRVNTCDLALYLKGVEVMIVKNHFQDGYAVELVKFSDNSTYALTSLALTINGTSASDSLSGFNITKDTLSGNAGDDYLYGYGGDDTLNGGTGHDYLAGGTGNDTYVFKAGESPLANPDYVQESQNEGTDTIKLTGGILPANVIMWTDPYNLHIRYSATDEINVVSGYGPTGETLIGSYVEKITFDNGTVWSLTGGLSLTDTDDTHSVIGSAFADTINGRGGDDSLYGCGGDDTLTGGTGHDSLAGGAGNDTYVFKAGDSPLANPDAVTESPGDGTDTIRLTGGILPANVFMWTDIYTLHIRYSATDEISVTGYYDTTGSLVSNYVEKIAFDNGTVWDLTQGLPLTDTDDGHSLLGSAGNDVIDGRGGDDTLYAYGGNDTITGGVGNDLLVGGAGDDVYKWGAGAGADYVMEESGSADKILVAPGLTSENLIYARSGSYEFKITSALSSADNITIQEEFYADRPGSVVEKVEFSDGFSMALGGYDNWIKGTSAGETLNGDPGGVTRNDTILGGAGNDTINGLNGDDTISGDAGVDTIHGNAGNDVLHGGSGNDVLYGDAGNDVLWGGVGADTLTGGTGADRFVFDASTASSDTIKDFSKTEDILDLSHLISGFDPVTKLITDFIQITDSGANSILKVDVDGAANGVNFVQVATLQNVTGLTDEAALMASGHLLAA